MADTPPGTLATVAVHEALIQQLIDGQHEVIVELRSIGRSMSDGEARFAAIELAQATCRAQHDSPENVILKALPSRVDVLAEQVATMRLVVYGAVGISLVGLLSTLGVVIIKVLSKGSP